MTGTGNLLQRAIPRLYLAASGTVTNDSVSDVLDSAQEVTKDTANEVNQFVQYFYDHIRNESLVCDYFLSDRKKSDQVDQEDCFQINGESKCRCGSQTVCRFYAEIRNVCSSDLSHRYKIWCGIFFSSGTDCISRCSHWSCSSGKSFQFCRGNTDPYFKTI